MNKYNLFALAPKELSTSAFIGWLANYIKENGNKNQKRRFFAKFLLDKNETQCNLTFNSFSIEKEKKVKGGRIELLLVYELNGEEVKVILENKTVTTTSGKQLSKYRDFGGELSYYVYLKLDYIDSSERNLCADNNYLVRDGKDLYQTLIQLNLNQQIVSEYLAFLKYNYVYDYYDLSHERIYQILKNSSSIGKGRLQRYVLDQLRDKIMDGGNDNLELGYGSSSGNPYATLSFKKTMHWMPGTNEVMFWRLDRRAGKPYLRLSQWSGVKGKPEALKKKWERRDLMRRKAADLLAKQSNIVPGKVTNSAKNESEIVIFFLGTGAKENTVETILNELPIFHAEFFKFYKAWVG